MNFQNKINKQGFFLIAEIGNNHGGSIKTAKKMIIEANKAGADAIKLQYINPKNFVHPSNKKKLEDLKKICLKKKDFIQLYKFAKKRKIEIFSSIFDISEISFFGKRQNYFKIASGDNNFFTLFKKISVFKKPTFISTGFLNEKGVYNLYKAIKKFWPKKFIKDNICVMHCVSSYPTLEENLNLLFLNKMNNNCLKGFSDHSIGINACVVANILGAKVIEKHFTLNKNKNGFRDHQLSADTKDFYNLKQKLILNQKLLGKNEKKLSLDELKEKIKSRRSLFANKNIILNQKILEKDLIHLRPQVKNNLNLEKKIINKKAKKNFTQYDCL